MPEQTSLTLTRLLSLITYIHDHPRCPLDHAAHHFGRTRRQLLRDVELIDQTGYGDLLPGATVEVDMDLLQRRGVLAEERTLGMDLPPRLTPDETTAVLVGLQAIAPTLGDDLRARIARTAWKVARLGRETERSERAVAVLPSERRAAWLSLLLRAFRRQCHVAFTYASGSGAVSERRVDPWDVNRSSAGWMLRGWCHSGQGERNFRLDRMRDLRLVADPIDHPAEDPAQVPARPALLTVDLGARWVADEVRCEVVHEDDRSLTVRIGVWEDDWFASLLVDLAPHVLAVDPPRYIARARARAREALRAWSSVDAVRGAR